MRTQILGAAAALVAAGCAMPAAAQEQAPYRYRVTVGAQLEPAYPGAADVSVKPLADFDRTRGDTPFEFEAADDGFGVTVFRSGSFEIGPSAAFASGRKPEDVGAPLPEVDLTVELGAFAQVWLGRRLRLHGEVRRGVNGHEGWVGVAGADAVWRDRDAWLFAIGPRVTWADDNHHDAYFSVTPASATATGLPAYDAGSGLQAYGATASAEFQLTRRWGLSAYGKYDRLTGDAADSPIVATYGAADQLSGGLGLSYSF
ncbi:MAG: hypothetical protein B7Z08_01635 [Sphingomonadales bacterium 32-68-7]|nr:MAG: hypothetical protein B7Z33_00475 [Sphingomonadales bacterium 12-68-11]OYX10281.1 MAG: hypothetical protein B7Z08_01635 [Sphingomonadales bacterium 32-68-7]